MSALDRDAVTIGGVRMSRAAAAVVGWAGRDPAEDVARLRNGHVTESALTIECLDGTDDRETVSAWLEYVIEVSLAAAAEVQS